MPQGQADGQSPVTVTIDNVKSDYNGDVYLSYVFSGTNDGVIIANIKFWQKAEATTEEPSTPSTETPSTEDTTKIQEQEMNQILLPPWH